ncbi:MAG: hypothetical protein ACE14V_05470 [bacterium]
MPMRLGINWKKDTGIKKYQEIFTQPAIRDAFGKHLQRILSDTGYIRYPGGIFTQQMPLEINEANQDYTTPGYPIFYQFCNEYKLKTSQQLPTSSIIKNNDSIRIKADVKSPINWAIADSIISQAKSMVQWLNDQGYSQRIMFWEIGNEDWYDPELRLRPQEYAEIVSRYLTALRGLIPPEKILVGAQPGMRGGSQNWGYEVLQNIKSRGLADAIGGVSTHIYPYFLNRPTYDSSTFDFNAYCLGDLLPQSFAAEYQNTVSALDSLGYNKNIKIHITECAVDVAGPRTDTQSTFKNNRKNYAAAAGIVRMLLPVAQDSRFGGAVYYCLFHKYLLTPEAQNPTGWKNYTAADDWGWGQCWYVPQQPKHMFINTPLLEAWLTLIRLLGNATQIQQKDSQMFMAIATDNNPVRLLFFNPTNNKSVINLASASHGIALGDGNLNLRAIKSGSRGDREDMTLFSTQVALLNGTVALPPYGLLLARGNDLKYNRVPLSPGFIKTNGFLRSKLLSIGEYQVRYEQGKLIPIPHNAKIDNYPLSAIAGIDGLTENDIAHRFFGVTADELVDWSIYEKDETAT